MKWFKAGQCPSNLTLIGSPPMLKTNIRKDYLKYLLLTMGLLGTFLLPKSYAQATICINCGETQTLNLTPVQGGTADDLFNQFDPLPSGGATPNNFEMVFQGNVTSVIPAQPLSNYTDAFLNPNPIKVSYSASSNTTTVTFSGSNGFAYPFGNTLDPHFGLDAGLQPATPLVLSNEFWSLNGSDIQNLPAATISRLNGGNSNLPDPWAIIYLNETITGTSTTGGVWEELPFVGPLSFQVTNGSAQSLTLSDVQYFVSNTQIPLDNLNFNDYPPNSSPFILLPGLNGTVLGNGQTLDVSPTPEPSTWLLFGSGLGVLGIIAIRKKKEIRIAS